MRPSARSLCASKTAMERRITLDGTNTMKYDRGSPGGAAEGGEKRTGQLELRCLHVNRLWSEIVATITRGEPLWHVPQPATVLSAGD